MKNDKIIIEKAKHDTSTYLEGNLGIKENLPKDEDGSFSFFDAINKAKEMNLL